MSDDTKGWIVFGLLVVGLVLLVGFGTARLDEAMVQGEAEIAAGRQTVKMLHPDWPWDLLDAGTIQLGMSEIMVLLALGTPDLKNETVDASGTHGQWIYRSTPGGHDAATIQYYTLQGTYHRATHRYEYVYIDNGVLTAWQN